MNPEEDDYMSDKFLQGLSKEDIRPGVPKRKADQRQHEMYKKKLKSKETPVLNETTRREVGLNTAITNDNKGFQMLEKMGYKPGTSLGKTNEGLIEPINISLKANNKGLGTKQKKIIPPSAPIDTKEMEIQFKQALVKRKHVRLIRRYFFKAQSCCEHYDNKTGIEEPENDFFWPEVVIRKLRGIDEESADAVNFEENVTEENLYILVDYLRSKYFYCVFCAATATDLDDLNSYCPGRLLDDHNLE